jgi:hypothetical protein
LNPWSFFDSVGFPVVGGGGVTLHLVPSKSNGFRTFLVSGVGYQVNIKLPAYTFVCFALVCFVVASSAFLLSLIWLALLLGFFCLLAFASARFVRFFGVACSA